MLIPYDNTEKRLEYIIQYLRSQQSPKDVDITTPNRSKRQNSTFYDNVGIIAEYLGNSPDEQKRYILNLITDTGVLKMYSIETDPNFGAYKEYRETRGLDRKEFAILMDFVFQFGRDLGLQMHDPALLGLEEQK